MGSIIRTILKVAISRVLLRTAAVSLLGAMATNCLEPDYDTTDSGCAGPYEPVTPHEPTPEQWVRLEWWPGLSAISGNNSNNLVVVGERGLVVPLATHERQESATLDPLYAVWAGDGVAVAVGAYGTATRFDGSKWTSIPTNARKDLHGVWGTSGTDVFAVGETGTVAHFDGFAWTLSHVEGGHNLLSVWGSSSTDVFALGVTGYPEHPVMFHYDGSSWQNMGYFGGPYLADVWGTSHADVFAVGGSRSILHYDGRNWDYMIPLDSSVYLSAVWGASSTDVYAVGYTGVVMHYDGIQWTQLNISAIRPVDVGGTGSNDVYIVQRTNSKPSLLHFDGSQWGEELLYREHGLNAIFSESAMSAYAVGDAGTILHKTSDYYGVTSPMASGTSENLNSVWKNGGEGLIAVGDAGTILHYDGNAWSKMQSPTTVALRDVWSWPGLEVYAVGDGGTILQYKNHTWTPMLSGVTADLNAVWGASSQDVYAVGNGGAVVRYDGTQWKLLHPGTKQDLLGVWVGPGGTAVVVGSNGTFLTRSSGWHVIPTPPVGDLRAVWGATFDDLHLVSSSAFLRFNGETISEMNNSFPVSGALTALHGDTRSHVLAVSNDGSIYQFYPRQ